MRILLSILAVAVALVAAAAGTARAGTSFIVQCDGVQHKYGSAGTARAGFHENHDDPIVAPNVPGGSAHLHSFVGNPGTSYSFDVYADYAGDATSCGDRNLAAFPAGTAARTILDPSGYWQPVLWYGQTHYHPDYARVYYARGVAPAGKAIEWVQGMELIGQRDSFSCGAGTPGDSPNSAQDPYSCADAGLLGQDDSRDGLVARVIFPQCWDGSGHESSDFTYPVGGSCSSGHYIPQIRVGYHYNLTDAQQPAMVTFGDAPGQPGNHDFESLHGDFFDGWDTTEITGLIARCLNTQPNTCPSFASSKIGDSGTPPAAGVP